MKELASPDKDLMVSGMLGSSSSGANSALGQEFCLKWNNHRTTILSVMDALLEEESLVDVTLSADGQFIRAHRVILSACSPYFRTLFKSSFLLDKHPVIVMKDVDFDNLKSLVEYMYKGEANVPQHMLPSFIQTAESLQIRGLAEGASKQKLEQVAELNNLTAAAAHLNIPSIPITPHSLVGSPAFKAEISGGSTISSGSKKNGGGGGGVHHMDASPGGILAARLAKMVENPPMQMFDFQEQLAMAARQHPGLVPPPMKKPRRTTATPVTSSPLKSTNDGTAVAVTTNGGGVAKQEISVKKDLLAKSSRMSPKVTNIMATSASGDSTTTTPTSGGVFGPSAPNNNYESDSDVLKIDEDRDKDMKENGSGNDRDDDDDDIADLEAGLAENGLDDSEEEAMSHKELAERAGEFFRKQAQGSGVGFINPWTGEEIPGIAGSEEQDEDSMTGDGIGPVFPALDNSLTSLSRSMDISVSGGGSEDRSLDAARDPMTNKYSCTRCGRSYLHQATLVRHQRYECGISASYPCQLCGRKFKRRDVLKGHMEKCMNKTSLGGGGGGAVTASTVAAAGSGGSSSGSATPVTTSPLVPSTVPTLTFPGALQ